MIHSAADGLQHSRKHQTLTHLLPSIAAFLLPAHLSCNMVSFSLVPAAITAPISFVCMALFALFTLFIGLRFITTPAAASRDFGLTPSLTHSAGTVKGVRDLFTAATILTFVWLADQRAVGVCALLGALIPAVDGWVAAKGTGGWDWGRAMQHWCGVPAALWMARSLLA